MKFVERPRFRFALLTLALFTILAGDVWRYSLTWFGFAAIVVGVSVFSVLLLVKNHDRWSIGGLPYPLLAFVALSTVSILWSAYPSSSAVGIAATLLTVLSAVAFAVSFDWSDILRALGVALRFIIGLSFAFELFVAFVLRRPVLPPWFDYGEGPYPKALYWSRNVLFDDGKIQGVVGNSALLGFLGLLALIVFGIQLARATAASVRWRTGIWLALAALTVFLTRSATITLALVAVVVVTFAILAIRRVSGRARVGLYALFVALVAALVVAAVTLSGPLLALLGKSPDLTGRTNIWTSVIELAQQRPVFGWGWVSYWTPWAEPLNTLAFEGGVKQFQAHNAWLDIWLQLGIVGVVVFGALVASTTVRAWLFATDRRITKPGTTGSYTVESLLPVLTLTALLVQSLAESRLIVEYGLLLLVITAVKTKSGERPPTSVS